MARRESTPESPGSRALIVDLIRSAGPISRVELVEATGLTQPAVSMIVRRLIDDKVIVAAGSAPTGVGKPRQLLDINRRAQFGIGFQLGYESMTFVATDSNGGVIARERQWGAGDEQPDAVTQRAAESIRNFILAADIPMDGIAGVALAVPGPIAKDLGSLLDPPALKRWSEYPIRQRLEKLLGMPVLVDNDASVAALGEFWSRNISRYRSFGAIYIGTGIGAGVVIEGSLYRGASSNAAEIGHISINLDGPVCFCGNIGCLEQYASPAAIIASALDDSRFHELGLGAGRSTEEEWESLSRAAVAGHAAAEDLMTRAAQLVASTVVTLCNMFDLDDIVLTGPAVATAGSIYVREIRIALHRAFARKAHPISVELSANARDAAAIGAAAMTLQGALAPGHGPALAFTSDYAATA